MGLRESSLKKAARSIVVSRLREPVQCPGSKDIQQYVELYQAALRLREVLSSQLSLDSIWDRGFWRGLVSGPSRIREALIT